MEVAKSIADIKAVPFFSQFTEAQIRKQVERSKEGIEFLLAKAISTGKKANGYTVEQLKESIANYDRILKS